jgi:hypothetical protein
MSLSTPIALPRFIREVSLSTGLFRELMQKAQRWAPVGTGARTMQAELRVLGSNDPAKVFCECLRYGTKNRTLWRQIEASAREELEQTE